MQDEPKRLPMTPDMAAALGGELRLGQYAFGLAVIDIPILAAGYFLHQLGGAVAIALGVLTLFVVVYLLLIRPQARRDLDAAVFVRARGRIELHRFDESPDQLQTPDGKRLQVETDVVRAVAPLATGVYEVDYAPAAGFLFEIRDADGRTVYRHPRLPKDRPG